MRNFSGYTLTALLSTLAIGQAALAASPAPAPDLVRGVKVVEGTATNVYVGTQYGNLLYTFDLDSKGTSSCTQTCAEKWPPFVVSPEEAKLLASPFGTTVRASGLLQVTIDVKPVYTYYLNRVEGDDLGDGVGGVWHDIDFK